MIPTLYETFQHWSSKGSVYILSDTHFDDSDCRLMDADWIQADEQVDRINKIVHKTDTLILLGDVGDLKYVKRLRAGHKVLIMGNHDTSVSKAKEAFDEVYEGPLFISEKILLSHEPIAGLDFCLNIHGHVHDKRVKLNSLHLNLAANICEYTPVSLGKLIEVGYLSKIQTIHRETIDRATKNAHKRKRKAA